MPPSARFYTGQTLMLVEDVETMPFSTKLEAGTKVYVAQPGRFSSPLNPGGTNTYKYTIKVYRSDGTLDETLYKGVVEDALEDFS